MIRKALSDLKGGKLAENIKAAGVVVVISDVIKDGIEAIGSAPMSSKKLPSRAEIRTIINRYDLKEKLSEKVLESIENYESAGSSREFEHHIIVDNHSAVKAGVKKALELGYQAFAAPFQLEGEARDMAKKTAAYIKNLKIKSSGIPICVVIGGETTVTLKGEGKGGRNQEFVLAMMKELKDREGISYFSGGTDGIDGNSDYAGAFGSRQIYEKSVEKNLDIDEYLNNNDATTFFQKTRGVLKTGYTGTNVADIAIILKE
jgi:hydroxypyruvate reductase/glycerate 2-kinase